MTKNTVIAYDGCIDSINVLFENASNDEKDFLESCIKSLQKAKICSILEKADRAEELFESGKMNEEDYAAYLEAAQDAIDEIEFEITEGSEEASVAMSLALAESENKAFNTQKLARIYNEDVNVDLADKDVQFLSSRLDKYNMVFGAEDETIPYVESELSEGVKGPATQEFIESAMIAWSNFKHSAETAAMELIEESVERYGDTNTLVETIQEAVENDLISAFASKPLLKMVDIYELQVTNDMI